MPVTKPKRPNKSKYMILINILNKPLGDTEIQRVTQRAKIEVCSPRTKGFWSHASTRFFKGSGVRFKIEAAVFAVRCRFQILTARLTEDSGAEPVDPEIMGHLIARKIPLQMKG